MKRLFSRLLSLVLVVAVFLVGCSSNPASLTGNYRQDTLALIDSLRTAIELPEGTSDKSLAQSDARTKINDFISRYRRDNTYSGLGSFSTMTTALNGLAGHYASYPNRPVPEKLKSRLEQQFKQVESSLNRESA
ncbi:photosystem II protein Psb27 [Synechococcales cyanobacterium C]|uniref:Photosystem II lipoprotein Psb27 n=1 Tax=Petrachloros mirabilis ULC683 TaxID=2781853 RepID=A0A8K2A256_9CYAN|nr:photosystem II protein Psb27 [Petrachloros mirabilis]NCJ08137.1 photosystem II protein Psb27 [Petrachloros mirabilis ULC683]